MQASLYSPSGILILSGMISDYRFTEAYLHHHHHNMIVVCTVQITDKNRPSCSQTSHRKQ